MEHSPITPPSPKILMSAWAACGVAAAVGLLFPVNFIVTRLALIGGLLGLWAGALVLFWPKKVVRFALLILAGLVAVFLALPGRDADPDALRREYVRQLLSYEGTRYVWGGENRIGIDCSGLVRRALINANVNIGVRTANPALLRRALSLWWFDRSARALREEYRADTRRLFSAESINALDHSRLLPGDVAVMANGIHTLAYIGDQTWICADSDYRRVIRKRAPAADYGWFTMPVDILQWRQFRGAEHREEPVGR